MMLQDGHKIMVDDMSDFDPDEFQKEKDAFLEILENPPSKVDEQSVAASISLLIPTKQKD